MRKLSKLFIVLVAILALTAIFAIKTDAATIEDITFDPEYYLARYQDVAQHVNNDYAAAYDHYLTFGIREGRAGSPVFNVSVYLNSNSDLYEEFYVKGGENLEDAYVAAYNHFVTMGVNELRVSSEWFDGNYYIESYQDLKENRPEQSSFAYDHYLACGINEGRNPSPVMAMECYSTYSDLINAFGPAASGNWAKYARHWFLSGNNVFAEGRAMHNVTLASTEPATCTKNEVRHFACPCGRGNYDLVQENTMTEHTWDEGVVTTAATCTEKGVKTYTCSVCGTTRTEEVAASGHNYVEVEATDATCVEEGTKAGYQCSVCGKFFDENKSEVVTLETPVNDNHNFEYAQGEEVYVPVVVTEEGAFDHIAAEDEEASHHALVCKVCNEAVKEDEILDCINTPAGYYSSEEGHSEVCAFCGGHGEVVEHTMSEVLPMKEPTCTEDGLLEGFKCEVCGYEDQEVWPATGHDYSEPTIVWELDEEGYYTGNATAKSVCKTCGAAGDEVEVTVEGPTVITEATCTTEGKVLYTATLEGEPSQRVYAKTKPLGHTYEFVEEDKATCAKAGVKAHYVCTVCGALFNDDENKTSTTENQLVEPKLEEHTYGAVNFKWQETSDPQKPIVAYASATCSVCGKEITLATETTKVVTKEPTCLETGLAEYTAKASLDNGKATISVTSDPEVRDIPALGHDWSDGWTYHSSNEKHWTNTCKRCQLLDEQSNVQAVFDAHKDEATYYNHIKVKGAGAATAPVTVYENCDYEVGESYTLKTTVTVEAGGTIIFPGNCTVIVEENGKLDLKDGAKVEGDLPEGLKAGNTTTVVGVYSEDPGEDLQEALENKENVVLKVNAELDSATTVESDLTIEEGVTLTVADNANFATSQNNKISNNGTIVVHGKLGETLNIENGENGKVVVDVDGTDNKTSLAEAVEADFVTEINASGTNTVEESLEISAERELTITLSDDAVISGKDNTVKDTINNQGTLTINGGKVSATKTKNEVAIKNESGTLTLNDVELEGTFGLVSNNSANTLKDVKINSEKSCLKVDGESTLTVTGGEFTSQSTVANLMDGTATISGCTISGETGVSLRGGSLVLSNVTITATGTNCALYSESNGALVCGAALAIRAEDNDTLSVTINDGTVLKSTNGYGIYVGEKKDVTSGASVLFNVQSKPEITANNGLQGNTKVSVTTATVTGLDNVDGITVVNE